MVKENYALSLVFWGIALNLLGLWSLFEWLKIMENCGELCEVMNVVGLLPLFLFIFGGVMLLMALPHYIFKRREYHYKKKLHSLDVPLHVRIAEEKIKKGF